MIRSNDIKLKPRLIALFLFAGIVPLILAGGGATGGRSMP